MSFKSRPARALWIEIEEYNEELNPDVSRPARALWIEIYSEHYKMACEDSRGPRGPCGLKYLIEQSPTHAAMVEAREGLVD